MVLTLARNLSSGRCVRAAHASQVHWIVAAADGINIGLYKPMVLAISAAFTATALGAMLPDFGASVAYGVLFSMLLLVGAVAGGIATV